MKKIGLYLTSIIIVLVLSSMAWVNITVTRPAIVILPGYMGNIAIIDRTLQDKTKANVIEKTITGEAFHQDDQAVRQVAEGVIAACANYGKYNLIRTSERYKSNGTKNTFPTPLSWEEVDELCKKNGSDALLSIEIFDSDFLITTGQVNPNKTMEGNIVNALQLNASGVTVINLGIRIYDPENKLILDEYLITHKVNSDVSGNALSAAANMLFDKTEAVNRTSYEAGALYGDRISPSFYTITREFYNKPKKNRNLATGVRKSEVADWTGAIESWTKALDDKKKKVRRRAAFNIAVAYEVLGDLPKAKEWASKAYTEYEEELANDYYNKIVYRINEEAAVEYQENK